MPDMSSHHLHAALAEERAAALRRPAPALAPRVPVTNLAPVGALVGALILLLELAAPSL